MNEAVKRNSQYPSVRLYDEVNRLRKRDSLPELDICQYGMALGKHFNTEDVPHVAEALQNLRQQGLELGAEVRRKSRLQSFLDRFKPSPEPAFSED